MDTAFPAYDVYNDGDEKPVCCSSSTGHPAVVVSLGFTREEVPEVEVALRSDEAAWLFPCGVRVVAGMSEYDDSTVDSEATTLRQAS